MAAEDFLGRVLVALAISPVDEGMPSHTLQPGDDAGVLFGTVREGGPTIVAGARRPEFTCRSGSPNCTSWRCGRSPTTRW